MMRVLGTLIGLVVMTAAACTFPRDTTAREERTCTSCHGDQARAGDQVAKAAPPNDLYGNTDTRFSGVGSHQRHLEAGPNHAPVLCERCHVVPATVLAAGHNDGVVQVIVPSLDGGRAYDAVARTCGNSACHTVASGVWTNPRTPAEACGSCHGVPPPAPHPQAGACDACHGALTATTHVDGTITRVAERCDSCHGADQTGAPPRGLDGGTEASQRSVGAHQAHLTGGAVSKPVACATCHEVPATVATARHPNGGSAEVLAAVGFNRETGTCNNACHANTPIEWTRVGPLSCSSCHARPPAAPHPQMTQCGTCHPAVSASARDHHVNGNLEVAMPTTCDGCHGSSTNFAPPRGLDGGTETTQQGVGAHQAHLVGRGLARPVQCAECHTVPASIRVGGHLDGVVQVAFSGVAVNGALTPSYNGSTCANSACHDLTPYNNGLSVGGTTPAPQWVGDAGSATCTSCHGLPPSAPHVQRTDCASCHRTDPALHVNGHLDFAQ